MKTYNKNEALEYARSVVDQAINHSSYLKYRRQHIESQKLYDGGDVLRESDRRLLKQKEIFQVTANLIAPIIDNLSGVELQTRYRVRAEVDDISDQATKLSAAMTTFMSNIQEDENADKKNARALRDSCIGGLGWVMIAHHQNRTFFERIHPLEIIPDFNDITDQFTKMDFVIRMLYIGEQEAKMRWKGKASEINFSNFAPDLGISPRLQNLQSPCVGFGVNNDMNCICEVQFKVPKKAYAGISSDGRYFETFDIDKANEIVEKKNSFDVIDGKEIRRIIFCQGVVLEYSPLSPSFPDQEDFSYIPIVYKKDDIYNVPYGMVEGLKTLQLEANARLTKAIRSYTAEKTFIKNASSETMVSIRNNPSKWKDPNAVIALQAGEDVMFSRSTEMGDNQLKSLESSLNLIKRTSGVEDESRGIPTNATSGISQKLRDQASLRTNAFLFDNFNSFKIRQGKHLISILKNTFLRNIAVKINDEGNEEIFYLNFYQEDSFNNVYTENDISFQPFRIVVEEVPSFRTSLDSRRLSLETIASLPFQEYVWMSEEFLRLYTDKPKKLKEEIMKARKEIAAMQNPQNIAANSKNINSNEQEKGVLDNVS